VPVAHPLETRSFVPFRISRKSPIAALLSIAIAGSALAGCGNNEQPEPNRFPALTIADPLQLNQNNVAVGIHHGEMLAFRENDPEGLAVAIETFQPRAVLHLQSYDELAWSFGEHTYFPTPSGIDARNAVDFQMDRSMGELAPRADDLISELEVNAEAVDAQPFERKTIVVDFWRTRGDWWIRWDGILDEEVNTRGKGPYGFGLQEFANSMVNQIETVAQQQKPDLIIIGTDMERLFATDEGGAISQAEFSNFVAFYQRAAAGVRTVSPDTRIGVGFNWDRFARRVAPTFSDTETLSNQSLDAAFAGIILPLARISDVIALRSFTDTEDHSQQLYYSFLRRLPSLYDLPQPIVWYDIGTPVESPVGYNKQRVYLERFLEWNAGVDVESVAWSTLVNIDGADTANQQISGRCRALVDNEMYNLPQRECYDGLHTTVFESKSVFDVFVDAVN
jgi:hypothetical protein